MLSWNIQCINVRYLSSKILDATLNWSQVIMNATPSGQKRCRSCCSALAASFSSKLAKSYL